MRLRASIWCELEFIRCGGGTNLFSSTRCLICVCVCARVYVASQNNTLPDEYGTVCILKYDQTQMCKHNMIVLCDGNLFDTIAPHLVEMNYTNRRHSISYLLFFYFFACFVLPHLPIFIVQVYYILYAYIYRHTTILLLWLCVKEQ